MRKSCLKIPTPPMTPAVDGSHPRKCVAFSAEDLERIYIADEWDRTPTEVAQKLSYGDVLELKAIQRSLPTAPQQPDPLARRPHSQYLKGVPIGLLPLYDDSLPCNSVSKRPAPAVPPEFPPELPPVPSRSPNFAPTIPSSLSSTPISPSPSRSTPTTPTNPQSPRLKATFTFLPLLDAPTPPPPPPPAPPSSEVDTDDSDHDLSTPALSSASLDTTPSPRDYSDSESQCYFQLSTRKEPPSSHSYLPSRPPAQKSGAASNSTLPTPSPFSLCSPNPTRSAASKKPPQAHKESPLRLDINGETYHYGPVSTPPGSPSPPSLSPLSPVLRSPAPSSPPKYTPLFSQEQERRQDLQPSFSRSTARNPGPQKTLTRARDFRSPSPVLAPYCVSMKRGGVGSPCSSPTLGPMRGGTTSRKGRLEH